MIFRNEYLTPLQLDKDVIKRYVLEKIRQVMTVQIPQSMMIGGDVNSFLDHITGDLIVQWRMLLAGKVKTRQYTDGSVPIYGSWWEMFKEEYFTPWMLEHWPVKKTFIQRDTVIQNTYVCPHINVPDDDARHVAFLVDVLPPLGKQAELRMV